MMWPRARMLLEREKKQKLPRASRAELLAMIRDLTDENDRMHARREALKEALVETIDLDTRIDERSAITLDIESRR